MSFAAGADAGRGLTARAPGRLRFAPLLTAMKLSGYGLRDSTGGRDRYCARQPAGALAGTKKGARPTPGVVGSWPGPWWMVSVPLRWCR